jgi:hypothetical protein
MRLKPMDPDQQRRPGALRRIRRILLWAVGGTFAVFVSLATLGWYLDRSVAEKQCREDLTTMQNMVQKARADHTLDENHYPAAQKTLDAMQAACSQHDQDKVRVIALNLVAYLSFASDNANVKPATSLPAGDPKKNPHPVKRYELTATTDIPGNWDSVTGRVYFDVANDCAPQGSSASGRDLPYDFDMRRVGEKTWKGYFYRDFLQDEDYFGKGICHWDAIQAVPVFTVHGSTFIPDVYTPEENLDKVTPNTSLFKRSDFTDQTLKKATINFSSSSQEYTTDPGAFFPITVTIQKAVP